MSKLKIVGSTVKVGDVMIELDETNFKTGFTYRVTSVGRLTILLKKIGSNKGEFRVFNDEVKGFVKGDKKYQLA